MQALSSYKNMAIRVAKKDLVFAEPMGLRHLHLVQRTTCSTSSARPTPFMQPMVLLKEVHTQLFGGPGCHTPISAINTLVSRMEDASKQSNTHYERTSDRGIIGDLAAVGLLSASTVPMVTLLSLPCLVALMKAARCLPHHLKPVEMMCKQRENIMLTDALPVRAPLTALPPPPPPTPQHPAPRKSNTTPDLQQLHVAALRAKAAAAKSAAEAAKAAARADQLDADVAAAEHAAALSAAQPQPQQLQDEPPPLHSYSSTPTKHNSTPTPAATPPTAARTLPPQPPVLTLSTRPSPHPAPPTTSTHHLLNTFSPSSTPTKYSSTPTPAATTAAACIFPPPPPRLALTAAPARPLPPLSPPSPTHLLNSVAPTTETSFPTKLPSPHIWGKGDWLQKRFGFNTTTHPLPTTLKLELLMLRSIALDPQPNLSRAGVCTNQLLPESFERHHNNILRYTGCMVLFMGVDAARVSLWSYTHMSHFFLFLSFLQARGCKSMELKKQVATASMVLGHLSHQPGADRAVLERCMKHLSKLTTELQGFDKRQRGASTNPKQHVPPAAPAIVWQEQLMSSAQQAAQAELVRGGGTITDVLVMRQVRDAVMLGLAYGHATLVARLPLIRSLKATHFADRPCGEETCVGVGCKGNRLELVHNSHYTAPPPSSSSNNNSHTDDSNLHIDVRHSKTMFKLCCSHHKNSSKGVPGYEVEIPSARLHALLVLYERWCRLPLLMLLAGMEDQDDPGTLLFCLNTGKPLTAEQLGRWFRTLQVKHGLPLGGDAPLPPSHLRHIFATDRRQHPDQPGPSHAGAAAGMGNSVKVGAFTFVMAKFLPMQQFQQSATALFHFLTYAAPPWGAHCMLA